MRVIGASVTDSADVCRGASAAREVLARRGFDVDTPLAIEVADRLPEVVGPGAAGCFLRERERIVLLPYERFRRHRTWFGVPITREMYRALAAHEAAHAIAACNFAMPNPTIQAQEYVAYVTMFEAMPAALRARALRGQPGEGFRDADAIKPIVYLFDPMRFGAESYRHFLRLPDGDAFLREVLAGRALTD